MPALASLYAIFGLPPDADRETLDNAYRRLMKIYHPDRAGGDHGRAAEINRAYSILKDPAKRARFEGRLPTHGERTWPVAMVNPGIRWPDPVPRRRSRRRLWLLAGGALVAAGVAGLDVQTRALLGWQIERAQDQVLQLLDGRKWRRLIDGDRA